MAINANTRNRLNVALADPNAGDEVADILDIQQAISSAEAAFLDGAVAGTQAASKVIVNDANANQGVAKVTALHIGTSGSETQVNATAAEINQYCDESARNEVVTTTNVIAATESGKTFFLDLAGAFVSTLPAPALGLRFTFIVKTAPSGASYTVVTTSSANIIKGLQVTAEDAGGSGDSGTADDTISFVDGAAVAGDRVELFCDGTSWFAYAYSKVLAGITFTQAG